MAAAILAAVGFAAELARADNFTVTGQRYHAQVTDHYCAFGLDPDGSRQHGGALDQSLHRYISHGAGSGSDSPGGPHHNLIIPPQPTYNAGQVTFAPQVAIYNLIHGAATFTPTAGGEGNHSYVAYNVPPTVPWGDWASRTIANSIHDFDAVLK